MIEFLIRRFVPDWQQVQRTDVRERYGTLAAAVGICPISFCASSRV